MGGIMQHHALRIGLVGLVAAAATSCSLVLDTSGKSNVADGCTTPSDCVARSDGEPRICKRAPGATSGVCAKLTDTTNCKTVVGDWRNDNAIIFGSILSEKK